MQSTQTCDSKWHSTEFSAPNAKGCDPATRDCRGGRGMTWTVKRVQSVCHSSCYTSLLPCWALQLPARRCQRWGHSRCGMLCAAEPGSHITAARSPSAPSQESPFHSHPQGGFLVLTDSKKGTFVMIYQLELRRTGKAQPEASKWENLQVTPGWSKDS